MLTKAQKKKALQQVKKVIEAPTIKALPYEGAIKKEVKRVVSKNEEHKMWIFNFSDSLQCLQSTTAAIAGNYRVITPSNSTYGGNIAQGTANYQRVGNRVKISKAMLRIIASPLPYHATTNDKPQPMYLTLYFLRSKRNPTDNIDIAEACGANANIFFNNGNQGFSGYPADVEYLINRDNFTLLKKKVYKLGLAAANASGSQAAYSYFNNNDFKYVVKKNINITKLFPKTIKWNADNVVNSTWTHLIYQVTSAQVGALYANTQQPCTVQGSIQISYTDA